MHMQLTASFASLTESEVPWLCSSLLQEILCEINLWGFEHAHMKKKIQPGTYNFKRHLCS